MSGKSKDLNAQLGQAAADILVRVPSPTPNGRELIIYGQNPHLSSPGLTQPPRAISSPVPVLPEEMI